MLEPECVTTSDHGKVTESSGPKKEKKRDKQKEKKKRDDLTGELNPSAEDPKAPPSTHLMKDKPPQLESSIEEKPPSQTADESGETVGHLDTKSYKNEQLSHKKNKEKKEKEVDSVAANLDIKKKMRPLVDRTTGLLGAGKDAHKKRPDGQEPHRVTKDEPKEFNKSELTKPKVKSKKAEGVEMEKGTVKIEPKQKPKSKDSKDPVHIENAGDTRKLPKTMKSKRNDNENIEETPHEHQNVPETTEHTPFSGIMNDTKSKDSKKQEGTNPWNCEDKEEEISSSSTTVQDKSESATKALIDSLKTNEPTKHLKSWEQSIQQNQNAKDGVDGHDEAVRIVVAAGKSDAAMRRLPQGQSTTFSSETESDLALKKAQQMKRQKSGRKLQSKEVANDDPAAKNNIVEKSPDVAVSEDPASAETPIPGVPGTAAGSETENNDVTKRAFQAKKQKSKRKLEVKESELADQPYVTGVKIITEKSSVAGGSGDPSSEPNNPLAISAAADAEWDNGGKKSLLKILRQKRKSKSSDSSSVEPEPESPVEDLSTKTPATPSLSQNIDRKVEPNLTLNESSSAKTPLKGPKAKRKTKDSSDQDMDSMSSIALGGDTPRETNVENNDHLQKTPKAVKRKENQSEQRFIQQTAGEGGIKASLETTGTQDIVTVEAKMEMKQEPSSVVAAYVRRPSTLLAEAKMEPRQEKKAESGSVAAAQVRRPSTQLTEAKLDVRQEKKSESNSVVVEQVRGPSAVSAEGLIAKGEAAARKTGSLLETEFSSSERIGIGESRSRRRRSSQKGIAVELESSTKSNPRPSMAKSDPGVRENTARTLPSGKSESTRQHSGQQIRRSESANRSGLLFEEVPVNWTRRDPSGRRLSTERERSSENKIQHVGQQNKRRDSSRHSSSLLEQDPARVGMSKGPTEDKRTQSKKQEDDPNPSQGSSIKRARSVLRRSDSNGRSLDDRRNHRSESTPRNTVDASRIQVHEVPKKQKSRDNLVDLGNEDDDIAAKLQLWKKSRSKQRELSASAMRRRNSSADKSMRKEGERSVSLSESGDDDTIRRNNKSDKIKHGATPDGSILSSAETESTESNRAPSVNGSHVPIEIVLGDGALQANSAAKHARAAVRVKTNTSKHWKRYKSVTLDMLEDYIIRETQRDQYGGRLDVCDKPTGFFHVKTVGQRWTIVDPDGNLFFSIGVNAVSPRNDEGNYEKSFTSEYEDATKWANSTHDYLFSQLGFNTLGCWSDLQHFKDAEVNVPYCRHWNFMSNYYMVRPHGRVEQSDGTLPCFDMEFEKFCDDYAKRLLETSNDPWLFGHFSDVELSLNEHQIIQRYLGLPSTDPGHQAAVKWLSDRKITQRSITKHDDFEFFSDVISRYFQIVRSAVKKYDANHLFLGTRINGPTHKEDGFVVACSPWVDVISITYYESFTPDQEWLNNWSRLSKRPLMVTEWCAKGDDAPGCNNIAGAGLIVPTQKNRGTFYENFAIGLLRNRNVVGWHWFQYIDKQKSNMGIVNVDFIPYDPLAKSMHQINTKVYSLSDYLSTALSPLFMDEPEAIDETISPKVLTTNLLTTARTCSI